MLLVRLRDTPYPSTASGCPLPNHFFNQRLDWSRLVTIRRRNNPKWERTMRLKHLRNGWLARWTGSAMGVIAQATLAVGLLLLEIASSSAASQTLRTVRV